MVKNEKWRKPAGIDDAIGLDIINFARAPYRKLKAEKGPKMKYVSSADLREGMSIEAIDNGLGRD